MITEQETTMVEQREKERRRGGMITEQETTMGERRKATQAWEKEERRRKIRGIKDLWTRRAEAAELCS